MLSRRWTKAPKNLNLSAAEVLQSAGGEPVAAQGSNAAADVVPAAAPSSKRRAEEMSAEDPPPRSGTVVSRKRRADDELVQEYPDEAVGTDEPLVVRASAPSVEGAASSSSSPL